MKIKQLNIVVFLLVVAPVVVAIFSLLSGERWFPAGDMAQAELHMRGFFRHPPLVGAAGRIVSEDGFQGSHPGPSLWLAMLPVYVLGARSSGALMAAAASVHVVSIAVILWMIHRRGGRILTVFSALVILAILRSAGTDFMIEPWNPWLALLPFVVFVLLIVEVFDPRLSREVPANADSTRRNSVVIAAAIAVGSHCVQSHAGYALLVIPPLVAVLVFTIVRSIGSEVDVDRRQMFRKVLLPLGVALGTTLFVWMAPLVDQLRRVPGNITILLQHFGSPGEPAIGISQSWEILSSQLNVLGPWLLGPSGSESTAVRWLGFVAFILLVSWALYRSHRDQAEMFSALSVLVGFTVLGAISISRIFGPYYEYTVRWLWMITGMSIAFSLTILTRSLRQSHFLSRMLTHRSTSFASLAVIAAMSAVTIVQVADRVKLPGATDSRILAGLIDETAAALDPGSSYQIRFYDPYTLNATGFGLLLELERRGFDVKVDPEFAAAALPHRTAPMQETDGVLWVVVGPAIERAALDPRLTTIARFNPRSAEQQTRSRQLLQDVADGLRAAGRDDLVSSLDSPGASILFAEPPLPEATADLIRELISMGQPTGVFLMSVGDVAESLR